MEPTQPTSFNGIAVPAGEQIQFENGRPLTPARPIIPYIDGDGIGPEVSLATRRIVDAAVKGIYGNKRQIVWYEILASGVPNKRHAEPLPADTIAAIRHFKVAIKGPMTTPTGGGLRSLNVSMRQQLDLFQCVRPVRYFNGVPSVVVRPQDLNITIFRENTEDVYAGIEYEFDSSEAEQLRALIAKFGRSIPEDAGIGIKFISREGTRRLVRQALQHAVDNGLKVVTIVHKGNIQKFTEGAFQRWGYELAAEEFGDKIVTEADLWSKHDGKMPAGKILVNDRICDAMFFELLVFPDRYSVIATPNLNGDYLSDAAAAQVGGLGIAPGANIGTDCAIFEATHGTAQRLAGKNSCNPGSLLLSAAMMLDFIGWGEAAKAITAAFEATIAQKTVTFDLAEKMPESTTLTTSAFADAIISNLPVVAPVATPVVEPVVATVTTPVVEPVVASVTTP